MLGKQSLIEFFRYINIDTIFHLPGIHTLPFNETFLKSNINSFIGRHENNITIMADGYARTSGKIGVIVVTPGPGLGNAVSACMEAYSDDIPLFIIHVDTGREEIGKGILHELAEPETMFTYFTKKTYAISKTDEMIPLLNDAYRTAVSGRKGPVLVSIPYTFFEKEIPRETGVRSQESGGQEEGVEGSGNKEQGSGVRGQGSRDGVRGFEGSRGQGEKAKEQGVTGYDLSALEEILHGKKRPVIIGGKSLMFEEARPIIDDICRGLSIPFLTTTGGKGIVNENSMYSFGNIMQKGIVKEILSSSDIVIAIGTRLRDVDARRRGVRVKELIHIDIDDKWIGKNYPTKLAIVGDIKQILGRLGQTLKGRKFDWDIEILKKTQKKELEQLKRLSPGFSLIKLIRGAIPDDTVTVCDLNLPSYFAEYYFPVYHQNTFIMPRGVSPIFYSLPAAIGAKIGRPDRPCLALCGDGGILPAIGELATMVKYNIPVVIFVHNNNSFGILEDVMRNRHGITGSMTLNNPDFGKLANAFGIKSKKTKSLEGLKKIFFHDITWDKPFLIEFDCPVLPPPWRV
ncbi:MAG: thiamine pyrophosphate-binding protein [Proteobacteria bacterium]|nr:thiamine pyrophosphate-binding protein [Pseudomonadota bacterium]